MMIMGLANKMMVNTRKKGEFRGLGQSSGEALSKAAENAAHLLAAADYLASLSQSPSLISSSLSSLPSP